MFYHVIFMYRKISDEDIWGSSASLAFYLLLSFFPFLIALVSMLAFVPVGSDQILSVLSYILPENVLLLLKQNMHLLEKGRTSVASIGFISAVWIASKGVKALMRALNKSYHTFDKRAWWKKYFVSVGMIFLLAVGIIVSVFLYIILSNHVLDVISLPEWMHIVLEYMRSAVLYASMTAVMALIFKVVPDKKLKLKSVIPGALSTGIIWVIATVALGIYIDANGTFDNFYGTLGSVIALMVWLYLISFSILFGNAINSYRLESDKYE